MVLLSVKSIQGRREYMEDRYAYIDKKGIIIAMVCDGHGGYKVSDYTSKELPERLLSVLLKTSGTNVVHAEAIRDTIIKWGEEMYGQHSGSTLTGIAVKDNVVYIYNVGDSRTCMQIAPGSFIYNLRTLFDRKGNHVNKVLIDYSQKKFFCTSDHDSESPAEVARVNASGGKILGKRLNGILSVTRALGDSDVGPGIGYVPDIYWTNKQSVAGPIFMYSDGIYELQRYKPKDGSNFDDEYLHYLGTRYGSEAVVKYAHEKGSEDNLTAMMVQV